MRLQIALSSSTLKLSLPELPKAVAYIVPDFVWNKGTKYARTLPTLTMIQVPERKQGKGYGRKLFEHVLQYMKTSGTPVLAFDNFNKGFWDAMYAKYPLHISFKDTPGKSRAFGIIRLDASTDAETIFQNR